MRDCKYFHIVKVSAISSTMLTTEQLAPLFLSFIFIPCSFPCSASSTILIFFVSLLSHSGASRCSFKQWSRTYETDWFWTVPGKTEQWKVHFSLFSARHVKYLFSNSPLYPTAVSRPNTLSKCIHSDELTSYRSGPGPWSADLWPLSYNFVTVRFLHKGPEVVETKGEL